MKHSWEEKDLATKGCGYTEVKGDRWNQYASERQEKLTYTGDRRKEVRISENLCAPLRSAPKRQLVSSSQRTQTATLVSSSQRSQTAGLLFAADKHGVCNAAEKGFRHCLLRKALKSTRSLVGGLGVEWVLDTGG